MSIEKGKITGSQLMFLLSGYIMGAFLTVGFFSGLTKHDSWLVVIAALLIVIPFTLCHATLAKRFPAMNMVEINDVIYGKYFGKVISIYYFFFFILILNFNISDLSFFYMIFLIPDTPKIFFIIMFTLTCAFTVWKGLEPLARIAPMLVTIASLVVISTFFLLLPNMNFSNFLPIFEVPLKNFILGTHVMSSIPFAEIVCFLMIMCSLNNYEHTTKYSLQGLLLGAVMFLLLVIRNTAVLGATESISFSPSFQSSELIEYGSIFTRMDILISIGVTIVAFMKCSILYYVVVALLSQLFRLRTYLPLILPLGGTIIILSAIATATALETGQSVGSWVILAIPPLYILPPLTLLIAKIRNLPKQGVDKRI